MPNTQEDIIRSTVLLSILIFDRLEQINLDVFLLDLFLALSNCLFDRSIPIYFFEFFSNIFKNLPVPHPASKTILSLHICSKYEPTLFSPSSAMLNVS